MPSRIMSKDTPHEGGNYNTLSLRDAANFLWWWETIRLFYSALKNVCKYHVSVITRLVIANILPILEKAHFKKIIWMKWVEGQKVQSSS